MTDNRRDNMRIRSWPRRNVIAPNLEVPAFCRLIPILSTDSTKRHPGRSVQRACMGYLQGRTDSIREHLPEDRLSTSAAGDHDTVVGLGVTGQPGNHLRCAVANRLQNGSGSSLIRRTNPPQSASAPAAAAKKDSSVPQPASTFFPQLTRFPPTAPIVRQ